jgi:hypothetical protein
MRLPSEANDWYSLNEFKEADMAARYPNDRHDREIQPVNPAGPNMPGYPLRL